MSILVTGANGQVGRELLRHAGELPVHGLERSGLDITDAAAVNALLERERPRLVINAAAYTAVDKAESDSAQAHAINRDGPAHLAAACARAGIPLLHISTDYVFDGSQTRAYTEADPIAPLGVYGASKWAGEQAVRTTLDTHLILRVSWVFGALGHNFVKTMLRLGSERDELRIVADQHGGPTPAADIARSLLELARRHLRGEALAWGTYHYAGQPFTSWHGFAEVIFSEARAQGLLPRSPRLIAIASHEYPTPARRPANSALDSQHFTDTFGLTAPDWQRGLRTMLSELAR